MQTYNAGCVTLNPTHVTIKTPLVGKAMGNHLIKSTSLKKPRALFLISAMLEMVYAVEN